MKLILILVTFFGLSANARTHKTPPPRRGVHFVCMAVGAGGGSAGTSHVVWGRGRTMDLAAKDAYHKCALDTGGYGCGVSDCHAEYDTTPEDFQL